MKKFIVNLIIIVFVLFVTDFILFHQEKEKYTEMVNRSQGIFKIENITHYAKNVPISTAYTQADSRRHVLNKNGNSSILLAGCSYTYGTGLTEKQNFSHYLSEYTDKNVYNIGIQGGSPYNFLYLVQQDNFASKYKNVDLIIYTYISDHVNRLNEYLKCEIFKPYCNLRLTKKDGKYVQASEWYRFPSQIFLFRMFLKSLTSFKNSKMFFDKNTSEFANVINESYRQLKIYYPNAKFVFLIFTPSEKEDWLYKKLDKDIQIISTDEFSDINLKDKKYRHDNDPHPTEAVWREITPKLVKYLSI